MANVGDSETWVSLPPGAGADCAIPVRACWGFTVREPSHPLASPPFLCSQEQGKGVCDRGGLGRLIGTEILLHFTSGCYGKKR